MVGKAETCVDQTVGLLHKEPSINVTSACVECILHVGMSDRHAASPTQLFQFLVQMLEETAKMSQDQAASQRDHLAKLQEKAHR